MRLAVAWLVFAACGFDSHPPGDAGVDAGFPDCMDPDRDGYGTGAACRGPDCREDDPSVHDCSCAPGDTSAGCACDAADQPIVCYDGVPETAGVGICRSGLQRCVDGRWTSCEGQVLPEPENCDAEDDNCDGVVDDGVQSECGDCNLDCDLYRFGVAGEPFAVDDAPAVEVRADGSITVGQSAELRGVAGARIDLEFTGCPPRWGALDLSAGVPAGTRVLVEVRSGSTLEELAGAGFVPVLDLPQDEPPVELGDIVMEREHLEVRVTLFASANGSVPVVEWLTVIERGGSCGFE